MFEVCPAYTDT